MDAKAPSGSSSGPAAVVEAAQAVRAEIRAGRFAKGTHGLAMGAVQGNVAIMPADYANDFLRFCQFNPKPCPLIGLANPGDPMLPMRHHR